MHDLRRQFSNFGALAGSFGFSKMGPKTQHPAEADGLDKLITIAKAAFNPTNPWVYTAAEHSDKNTLIPLTHTDAVAGQQSAAKAQIAVGEGGKGC